MNIKKLIKILKEEIEVCDELISVEIEKGGFLLSKNIDGIMETSAKTENLSRHLEYLESERLKIVHDISNEMQMNSTYPTLEQIAEHIGGENAEIMINLGEKLKNRLIKLREESLKNDAIITSGLAVINISLSLLKGSNTTYTSSGEKNGNMEISQINQTI